jgi:hypothetical protein
MCAGQGETEMTSEANATAPFPHIQVGKSCLLNVMDEHFLVRIIEVGDDSIRVTFPGRDYPVEGMRIYLEFHDEGGFDCYPAFVLRGAQGMDDSIILEKPTTCRRTHHRVSCRIPTDLTVQVKDQVHIRKYDAAVLNISSGGVLIRSDAPFDFSTTVEFSFSLPGEPQHNALGQVVHIADSDDSKNFPQMHLYGIRLISPDPSLVRSINRFVTTRLRDIYPSR